MPIPQEGSLAAFFTLVGGMVIRVTAVDATTGAVVAGVNVSGVSLDVDDASSAPEPVEPNLGPQTLLPGPALLT